MSTQVKRRRGTTAENAAFTGAVGEIVVTTDGKRAAVHDGSTAGGFTLPNVVDVQNNVGVYGTVGGTANAITLTHTFPRTAHTAGAEIIFKPTTNNTTAVTVAIDSIAGTKAIEKMVAGTSTALAASDLLSGVVYRAVYDGTRYQLQTGGGSIVIKTQSFSASGTYTPDPNMKYCEVEAFGGGGGGASASTNSGGGGGGAGEQATSVLTAADIGASKTVTIGTGGAADSNGGNTSLGSLVVANGGLAGNGSASQTAGGGGLGGSGGTGQKLFRGAPGGSGGGTLSGSQSAPGGSGGGSGGGIGRRATNGTDGQANSGGGGAGGSGTSSSGGAGGSGFIWIKEFCSQ
jgi:hypothetical protein